MLVATVYKRPVSYNGLFDWLEINRKRINSWHFVWLLNENVNARLIFDHVRGHTTPDQSEKQSSSWLPSFARTK